MYKIIRELEKSSLAVFTITDLQKITGKSRDVLYVYLNRMFARGIVYKVEGRIHDLR